MSMLNILASFINTTLRLDLKKIAKKIPKQKKMIMQEQDLAAFNYNMNARKRKRQPTIET